MTLNRFFEDFRVFYFRVSDLERARAFYQGKLGFEPVWIGEKGGWAELSFGAPGRPYLGLNRYDGEGPVPTNAGGVPSFCVEDMEGLKAAVEAAGVPHHGIEEAEGVVDSSDHFWFLWIFDPDGNKIEFVKIEGAGASV